MIVFLTLVIAFAGFAVLFPYGILAREVVGWGDVVVTGGGALVLLALVTVALWVFFRFDAGPMRAGVRPVGDLPRLALGLADAHRPAPGPSRADSTATDAWTNEGGSH